MTFSGRISDIIAEKVKENKFTAHAEKYVKDSDEESEENDDNEINEEDDEEFNPLRDYKEEIERDKMIDREKKRVKMAELDTWRLKREKLMSNALGNFKKERDEYGKYKVIKEQSIGAKGKNNMQ